MFDAVVMSCKVPVSHVDIMLFRKRWMTFSDSRTWRKTRWKGHSRRHSTRSEPLVPR